MEDFSMQILHIYAVFIVLVCRFGVVSTAGSHLEMTVNTPVRGAFFRGHNELMVIIVKILCVGDVMIFRLLSLLKPRCGDILDKHIAGIRGRYRARPRWIAWEWRCRGGAGDVFGGR